MNRRTYFNKVANAWDEKYCTPELARVLATLVPMFDLKPGQRILDVGTGTGVLIPFLFQAIGPTGSITAVDFAEKMVQLCRSKYPHLRNLTVRLQNVEALDLPSRSFDAITCFGLFPHIKNKAKSLYHMNRVLKPNGRLIIAHALSSEEIQSHHKGISAVGQDHLPKEREMRQLLENAGFTVIYLKDKPGCYLCISQKSSS